MTTNRQNFEKECSVRFAKANFEYWKKMLNLKWVRFQIRNSMMIRGMVKACEHTAFGQLNLNSEVVFLSLMKAFGGRNLPFCRLTEITTFCWRIDTNKI